MLYATMTLAHVFPRYLQGLDAIYFPCNPAEKSSILRDITSAMVSGLGTWRAHRICRSITFPEDGCLRLKRKLDPTPMASPALVFDPGLPHVPPPSNRNATVRQPFRVSQGCATAEERAGWGKTTTSFRKGGRDTVGPTLLSTHAKQHVSRRAVQPMLATCISSLCAWFALPAMILFLLGKFGRDLTSPIPILLQLCDTCDHTLPVFNVA